MPVNALEVQFDRKNEKDQLQLWRLSSTIFQLFQKVFPIFWLNNRKIVMPISHRLTTNISKFLAAGGWLMELRLQEIGFFPMLCMLQIAFFPLLLN